MDYRPWRDWLAKIWVPKADPVDQDFILRSLQSAGWCSMTEHELKLKGVRRFATLEQVAREAQFKSSRLALLFGISERHLQRIFKCHFQCRPSRWLRQLQFELAKGLVEQGYSTKAAAFEMGFRSVPHFCREFKKAFGRPPQTFAAEPRQATSISSSLRAISRKTSRS